MILWVFIIYKHAGTWVCSVVIVNIDEKGIEIGIHGKCVTDDIAYESAEKSKLRHFLSDFKFYYFFVLGMLGIEGF